MNLLSVVHIRRREINNRSRALLYAMAFLGGNVKPSCSLNSSPGLTRRPTCFASLYFYSPQHHGYTANFRPRSIAPSHRDKSLTRRQPLKGRISNISRPFCWNLYALVLRSPCYSLRLYLRRGIHWREPLSLGERKSGRIFGPWGAASIYSAKTFPSFDQSAF